MNKECKTNDENPNTVKTTTTIELNGVGDELKASATYTTPGLESPEDGMAEEKAFKKLVDKYMMCDKRTLAEMLAMRDTNIPTSEEMSDWLKKAGENYLKKIIESPDTWRIHPEPFQPNTPYPWDKWDWSDYCYSAPYNKCIRGSGAYKTCVGCPYYHGAFYSERQDGTGNANFSYSTNSTMDLTHPGLVGNSKKQTLHD